MNKYLAAKLYIAVAEGNIPELKELVNLGANINYITPEHGDTLLHYAPNTEVTEYLLLTMAKHNVKDKYGQTPLCCAVVRPNGMEVVKALLAAGAEVNIKMQNGKTPLHYAQTLEMTKLLLKHKADVNAIDKCGRSPLHAALIEKKGLDVFKCLLNAGADINARMGEQKHTVLHYADSLDIIREILSRGFDVNVITTKKQTPLHLAVKHMKELAIIRELLEHGAKVDLKDVENDIPVYCALKSYKRDKAVIQLLCEYGSVTDDVFWDYPRNRRANCIGYSISRDMKLCKMIAKVHCLCCNGKFDKVITIGEDAGPKPDRDYLRGLMDYCCREIVNLKKHYIFDKYSVFDALVAKKIKMKAMHTTYSKLQQEMQEKFPYFQEFTVPKMTPYVERGRLLRRLKRLKMSVTNAKRYVITLNPDCTRFIIPMLPDDSLYNLLVASEL